ncbi:unnamed protein product [Clonostachys rosea]|uniref:Uncharacterized protein n=1 Tax=Bionectria ochroleuca TaxID=29856 RepID=A0ABY6TNE2_BIOOC|nr:unnamed protein product [Clonostachys rosea]
MVLTILALVTNTPAFSVLSLVCKKTLLDNIVQPDFGTTAVGSNSLLSLRQLVGDLCRHDLTSVSELVQYNQRFTVHLDNATHGCRVELHQVLQLELPERALSSDITCLTQILAEDGDFSVGLIRKESHAILGNLNHCTDLVAELATTNDLDVVTNSEALPQPLGGHLDGLSSKVALGHGHGDDIALHVRCLTHDTLLLSRVHLDDVTREVGDHLVAVLQTCRQGLEIKILCTIFSSGCEPRNFFQRRVHFRHNELLDFYILDTESVLKVITHERPSVGRRVSLKEAWLVLTSLNLAEQSLRGFRSGAREALPLPISSSSQRIVSDTVIQTRDKADSCLQPVLGNVKNLCKVTVVLEGNAEEFRHVLDLNQNHLGTRVHVEHAIESLENVVLALCLHIDETLHDGLRTTSLERGSDGKFISRALALLDSLHDGEDNLTLLTFLAPDSPNARVIHAREQETLGDNGRIAETLSRAAVTVALAEDLGLLLGIETGFHLSLTVELAMSSVVVEAVRVSDIIRMGVVDEALYFFAVSFLILAFVFVIDFGFDIEESSSASSKRAAS